MKTKKWLVAIVFAIVWAITQALSVSESETLSIIGKVSSAVVAFIGITTVIIYCAVNSVKRKVTVPKSVVALLLCAAIVFIPCKAPAPATPIVIVITVFTVIILGTATYHVVVRSIEPSVKCITVYEDETRQTVVSNFCARVTRDRIKKEGNWMAPFVNFPSLDKCYTLCVSNNPTTSGANPKELMYVVQKSPLLGVTNWVACAIATLGDYELEAEFDTTEPNLQFRIVGMPFDLPTFTKFKKPI